MRVAFVGKGGSGKSTLTALFVLHMARRGVPVLAIDADLNVHLPELLGVADRLPTNRHLARPGVTTEILEHLRGTNERISALAHFRKTTPPGRGSRRIVLGDPEDPILARYAVGDGSLRVAAVGTYEADAVGTACYHNALAILENVCSHLVDGSGVFVADMVAGVDAFANTLHVQFDLLVLVVEPTHRSVDVYDHYAALAATAGIPDVLVVVGNKVRDAADLAYLQNRIPADRLIGYVGDSSYLRTHDRTGGAIDFARIEPDIQQVLAGVERRLRAVIPNPRARLERLWELHRRYVAQAFIRDRFGDLTGQIDEAFDPTASV
jgi:CO dehydrogenase maturation factor